MRRISGGWGWAVLFAWVAAWDVCPVTETMSTWFAPGKTHGRKGMLILWAFLTAHLMRLIPESLDPLRQIPTIHRKEVST